MTKFIRKTIFAGSLTHTNAPHIFIALFIYAVTTNIYTALFFDAATTYVRIAVSVMIVVVFVVLERSSLTDRQLAFWVPTVITCFLIGCAIYFKGDFLIYTYITGGAMISLTYLKPKGLAAYIAVSSVIQVAVLFLFGQNLLGAAFSMLYNYLAFAVSLALNLIIYTFCKSYVQTLSDLTNAKNEANMATIAKSTFLANMSHEVRTPMNAILGVTEIMIQNDTLPAEIDEGLTKIYSSCDMLLGIINDILDFSKIEAGKLDIMPSRYNIANLVNDAALLNMMRIEGKPITFEMDINENVPLNLIGDELRIKQILNNFLSNAFKYTDKGRVVLFLDFEPSSIENKINNKITLILRVHDTGHGMTVEQQKKLFDEYSRFNDENTTIEGTGLGLAITRRLIALMDGEINVESTPGIGSLFTVRLPQEKADDTVMGGEIADGLRQFRLRQRSQHNFGKVVRDPMPYGSVLVVDDVETNLYVATGLMKPYKLQIETACSGREAIRKISDGSTFDVIFMDHMMPEMDGIETTKRLRKQGYSGPIVALTANAVAGQADVFLSNGFDAFISKPIDIRQLDIILNKLIRDKQPPEVLITTRQQNTPETPPIKNNEDIKIIESFVRDARKVVNQTDELLKDKNWAVSEENQRSYTISVHGIKSSLWNVDETELSEEAEKLEIAARKQNIDYITATTPDFFIKLRSVLEQFETKQAKHTNVTDSDVNDLRERLTSIKEMCAEYNRKGALDLIAGIEYYSETTKDVLDEIKNHILESDFEEAENAAAAYIEDLGDLGDSVPKPLPL